MTVRPIKPSDYDAINALHRRVGWPERSLAGWRWLEANPARREIDAPAGWVCVDAQDRPAAVICNFVQRFGHAGRPLHGATGFSIIVPPERKGASRGLIRAFLNQPDLFARYTLNANALSAPIYGLFGLKPWPPTTHALKLSWIVDPAACLRSRIWRALLSRIPAEAAHRVGERVMNARLDAEPALRLPPGVFPLTDLSEGSAYGAFWRRLSAEDRVLADRDPATLRWRLADPDQIRRPLLLAHARNGRIDGIALAIVAKANILDAPSLEIIDLTALEGADDAIPLLMKALIANARALGAARVRLPSVSPELLKRLGSFADEARREGGWGHCHVAFAEDAPDPTLWSPTPFDGDYSICLRPAPRPRRRTAKEAVHAPVSPSAAVLGRLSKA